MDTYLPQLKREKVLELSRQILSGQIDLIKASYEMDHLGSYLIGDIEYSYDDEFTVFAHIIGEVRQRCIPRGESRQYWNPDVLAKKDIQMQEILDRHYKDAIKSCHALLLKYQ